LHLDTRWVSVVCTLMGNSDNRLNKKTFILCSIHNVNNVIHKRVFTKYAETCHVPGGYFLTIRRRGTGLIPDQFLRDTSMCRIKRLGWSRGSVLTFGTKVRGFTPGRSRRIFRAKKLSARLSSEGK
jgi:hypothetical protein